MNEFSDLQYLCLSMRWRSLSASLFLPEPCRYTTSVHRIWPEKSQRQTQQYTSMTPIHEMWKIFPKDIPILFLTFPQIALIPPGQTIHWSICSYFREPNPTGHCQRAEVCLMTHPQSCHGQAESGTTGVDMCGAATGQRAKCGEANWHTPTRPISHMWGGSAPCPVWSPAHRDGTVCLPVLYRLKDRHKS